MQHKASLYKVPSNLTRNFNKNWIHKQNYDTEHNKQRHYNKSHTSAGNAEFVYTEQRW